MAAGFAAIEFMQEVDLPAHAARLGELTLELLREAQDTLPSVGEVRGRGLMIGIELVRDRDTKAPWPEMAAQIRSECFHRGVIIEVGGHYGNVAASCRHWSSPASCCSPASRSSCRRCTSSKACSRR